MPNRDHDDSQYNRSDWRYDHRDERSQRDQAQRNEGGWDRPSDEYRQAGGQQGSHGSDYQNLREQPQQRGASYGSSTYGRGRPGNNQGGDNYGERDGQRLSQQAWNRSATTSGPAGRSYGYGRPEYARPGDARGRDWDDVSQLGSGTPEWRSYAQDWSDHRAHNTATPQQDWGASGRAENPFNAQQRTRQEWDRNIGARSNYAQPSYGRPTHGQHEDESWGEQIRHAGQQVVRSVKRAFRGPKGYKRSDERIREDVNDRLAQQFDFDPSDIEVQVSSGDVTLTGTVLSRREKFIAEEIADDVSGVNEVHNQLRLRREDLTQTSAGVGSTNTTPSSTLVEGQKNRNSPRA